MNGLIFSTFPVKNRVGNTFLTSPDIKTLCGCPHNSVCPHNVSVQTYVCPHNVALVRAHMHAHTHAHTQSKQTNRELKITSIFSSDCSFLRFDSSFFLLTVRFRPWSHNGFAPPPLIINEIISCFHLKRLDFI